MNVKLQNKGGVIKEAKVGFSWTTFFFGFFPALFRGDLKWTLIIFIVGTVAASFTFGIGAWVSTIIFAFIYNKIYIKELIEKGYYPLTEEDQRVLSVNQIISPVQSVQQQIEYKESN